MQHPHHLTRRRWFSSAALTSLGLGLGKVLRQRATAAPLTAGNSDSAVILVWLHGGLSQIDTYDPKPDAPSEIRGDFHPIATNVPGIQLTDELPLHAQVADRFNLIRSMSHSFGTHAGAHKRILTGRVPSSPRGFVNEHPSVGSIVSKLRESERSQIPTFTSGQRADSDVDSYAQGAAYLGQTCAPFLVPGDPSAEDWSIPNLSILPELSPRLSQRRRLLAGFDRLQRNLDQTGVMASRDRFDQQAFEVLTSAATRDAFDLSQEDPQIRARYGMTPYGQQALLARRLVEAGTSFANVVMEHPGGRAPSATVYNWDCHAVNCDVFKDSRWRLPYFDRAISALIEDLYQRGLDRRVMLIVTGEFGHTPRLSYEKGSGTGIVQPGRDHWPAAMSMLVSGGGMRTGQVIGSTNALGEVPQERPLSPSDLWATVYRHLGIHPEQSFLDHSGRPMPILANGNPIPELC
ncbi:MAG: DUF1501 domain-containing protein [Pirellulaceae bacterium]|nr:DUF1501 domain-containing protein [Pirellulaceae bacterium]